MTVLALLMGTGLVLIATHFVLRRLGWPAEPRRALSLGIVLLAVALALGAVAERSRGYRGDASANDSAWDGAAGAIPVLALAALGYRWVSARLRGEIPLRPMRERRRALPPPPPQPAEDFALPE